MVGERPIRFLYLEIMFSFAGKPRELFPMWLVTGRTVSELTCQMIIALPLELRLPVLIFIWPDTVTPLIQIIPLLPATGKTDSGLICLLRALIPVLPFPFSYQAVMCILPGSNIILPMGLGLRVTGKMEYALIFLYLLIIPMGVFTLYLWPIIMFTLPDIPEMRLIMSLAIGKTAPAKI